MYKIRRVGALLLIFGLGLVVGNHMSSWTTAIYLIFILVWMLAWDAISYKKMTHDSSRKSVANKKSFN
ncbi:hypothetical protein ACFFIF_01775 [Vagococcus entomophilus]|uniref:Uncharacterized protein n=1 Tax=Vagococcus entomophilus TaxID=1160095 RepID=A0A430AK86_9ENTE|nr:hypothetical protein [Vagococcus entomophilus]RSU08469.1 hypothetical protein CBF30_04310 [Vagococcus entomophilus]